MAERDCSRGSNFPLLGLGTFRVRDPPTISAVIDVALSSGYKLIDTAAVYRNEALIGQALKQLCPKHNLQPEEIFITSKLAPRNHGYGKALAAYEESVQALGRPHPLDLYLIHWPGVQGKKREDPSNAALRRESWKAMEELYRRGKVKAIGVSNYTVKHLEELLQYATIKPAVLQSECHPFLRQREVRSYCAAHGIFFQAYSSLGTGELLQNSTIEAIARKYGRSAAQILLRWAIQQGIGVIPKSSNPAHVKENTAVFDFEMEAVDLELMDSLDRVHHFCWDPSDVT